MQLSELIKESRKKKGWTQEQLAEKLHVQVNTVQNWEAGRNNPDNNSLKQIVNTLTINENQLAKALISNLIESPATDTFNQELRWRNLLPDDFNMSSIQDLFFNQEEQSIFNVLALHSEFNANPLPELIKINSNYEELLKTLNKFKRLKLYTNECYLFSEYNADGVIASNVFSLSSIGYFISNWILKHPGKLFNIYDLSCSDFFNICRRYELNVLNEGDIEWLKDLVLNQKALIRTFRLSGWQHHNSWIELNEAKYVSLNEFHDGIKDEVERLVKRIRTNFNHSQQIPDAYFFIESCELSNPEYLLEKELYLKKVELQKDHPNHFHDLKDNSFEVLSETYIRPSEKAIKLINTLNEE